MCTSIIIFDCLLPEGIPQNMFKSTTPTNPHLITTLFMKIKMLLFKTCTNNKQKTNLFYDIVLCFTLRSCHSFPCFFKTNFLHHVCYCVRWKTNFLNLKISTSSAEIRTKMNLKQAMTSLQGMAEFYFFSLSSLLPELGSLC